MQQWRSTECQAICQSRGFERANEKAKAVAKWTGTRRYPERFAYLAVVGNTVTERKSKEAKHRFGVENDRRPPRQRAPYKPALEIQGRVTKAMRTAALVSRLYFQLKSRHAVT